MVSHKRKPNSVEGRDPRTGDPIVVVLTSYEPRALRRREVELSLAREHLEEQLRRHVPQPWQSQHQIDAEKREMLRLIESYRKQQMAVAKQIDTYEGREMRKTRSRVK